jgi:hypothetical protein
VLPKSSKKCVGSTQLRVYPQHTNDLVVFAIVLVYVAICNILGTIIVFESSQSDAGNIEKQARRICCFNGLTLMGCVVDCLG